MKTVVQIKNHETSIILTAENDFEQELLDKINTFKKKYTISSVMVYEKVCYDKNILEILLDENLSKNELKNKNIK